MDNGQSGKFECSGDSKGAVPIKVVITKDAEKFSVNQATESINNGEEFTFSKNNGKILQSETKFDIVQGGQILQSLAIHTSCSKDLVVGDRLGRVTLNAFIPK